MQPRISRHSTKTLFWHVATTYAVFSSIAGLVFQPKNRKVNLLNFKDVYHTKLRSHTVYKFMCSCYNATYYGQTQTFFVRVSEHLGNAPLTGKFVKTPKRSTTFYHLLLDGHKARFGNFSILLKDSIKFKLQLKEYLLKSHDFNKISCQYIIIITRAFSRK